MKTKNEDKIAYDYDQETENIISSLSYWVKIYYDLIYFY